MRNIVLKVSYDGTAYLGWQKTPDGKSIEETLESAITRILNHRVQLQAASRTDAGVHAQSQFVNFFTEKSIALYRLAFGINALLPKDIVILDIFDADLGFHPTLDCHLKEYAYNICFGRTQSPLRRHYSWHTPPELDLAAMNRSAKLLTGTHDFEAFCNVRRNFIYKDYVRDVSSITLEPLPDSRLLITICGKNFLYKMVRNIVGTLVHIGQGKISEKEIPHLLESRDRRLIGVTAPGHGLCLQRVIYSAGIGSSRTEACRK